MFNEIYQIKYFLVISMHRQIINDRHLFMGTFKSTINKACAFHRQQTLTKQLIISVFVGRTCLSFVWT